LLGLLAALTVGAAAYAAFLLMVGGLLPRDRARVEAIVTAVAPRSKWVARIIPRPQPST